MNIALWVVQGILAFAFLAAGTLKITRSREQLAPKMTFVEDYTAGQVKLIGLAEVLGAFGLVLPMALNILPVLTPVAAGALVIVMIGAIATHVRRKEPPAPPVILGALALVVAVGRFLS